MVHCNNPGAGAGLRECKFRVSFACDIMRRSMGTALVAGGNQESLIAVLTRRTRCEIQLRELWGR